MTNEIEESCLPTRIKRALSNKEPYWVSFKVLPVTTFIQIDLLSDDQLLRLPEIGRKALNKIRETAACYRTNCPCCLASLTYRPPPDYGWC